MLQMIEEQQGRRARQAGIDIEGKVALHEPEKSGGDRQGQNAADQDVHQRHVLGRIDLVDQELGQQRSDHAHTAQRGCQEDAFQQ